MFFSTQRGASVSSFLNDRFNNSSQGAVNMKKMGHIHLVYEIF